MENSELPIVNPESQRDKPFDVGISTQANEEHPTRNEDTGFCKEKNNGAVTFGIFDGMGGESNGRESSNLCSAAIELQLDGIYPEMAIDDIKRKLGTVSEDVNDEFLDKKSELHLGGSTGVFGMIIPDKSGGRMAVIANIGDSRAYVFRNGELIKITTDQGLVKKKEIQDRLDEAMNRDELTVEEEVAFRNRRIIAGCFGNPSVKPEIVTFPLEKGDILLVTTDGVHDNLTTSEIRTILNSQHSKKAADISRSITDASVHRSHEVENFRHKLDDMTALVIKFEGGLETKPKQEVEPQPLPEKFIPIINQSVNVQRSNGIVESGWVIKYIKRDGIVVHKKEENGEITIKKLSFDRLDRFNRQPKVSDIASSENFHQLFYTLNKLGGIQGSETYYPKDYLISVIKKYLKDNGEADIKNITRSAGLRDVVQELFRSKQQ